MNNKIALQFRKSKKTRYTLERLKICKKCSHYSVLFEDRCQACGAESSYMSVPQYTSELNHKLFQVEILIAIAWFSLSLIVAGSVSELILALTVGAALSVFYFLLRKRYKPYIEEFRLQKLLDRHVPAIAKGLETDVADAVADIQNAAYKSAYEKLREIGRFLTNDRIKIRKIMCLNYFVIRKDMELELETVMPSFYNQDFVEYLWEVSKVNKQLIRQSVLDYVVTYRAQIEEHEHGKEILTNVAGAALRMKHYVETYQSLIMDYMEELPKERFLRLCKLLASSPESDWSELYSKCKESARIRFAFDPEFQGIW
jgi:primosomal replication protein N